MNHFRVAPLPADRVRQLYTERLREDFPPDELKPLSAIEEMLCRGRYVCYGAADGDEILAYAFFVKNGKNALADYFAVRRDLRDRGIGSRFIGELIAGDELKPSAASCWRRTIPGMRRTLRKGKNGRGGCAFTCAAD